MAQMSDRTDLPLVRTARGILLVCFFLSGMTGLLYEIVWVRLFTQVFGNTVYSTATVIAAFMGGLGAGGWAAGRFIEKRRDAALWYAVAEIAIGLYAFVPGALVKVMEGLYPGIYGALGGSMPALVAVKALAALAALAAPTFCMGATLPLLSRFFVENQARFGNMVSKLYGLNTLGALTGTFLTGFILIRFNGIAATLLYGMVVNMGIGLLALEQHRKLRSLEETEGVPAAAEEEAGAEEPGEGGQEARREPGYTRILILTAAFVAGCVSISLEVAWTRTLALIIGSSVYAFTLILITFLLGIALGSLAAAKKFRSSPEFLEKYGLAVLGVSFLFAAATAAAGLPLLKYVLFMFGKTLHVMEGNYLLVIVMQFVTCVMVLLVPTFFFGVSFPAAAALYAARTNTVSAGLGRVYLWNTLGAILGSLLTGFALIPLAGVHATLVSGLLLLLAAGLALTALEKRLAELTRAAWVLVSAVLVVAVVATAKWDKNLMSVGPYHDFKKLIQIAPNLKTLQARTKQGGHKLLFYADGVTSTVTVRQSGNYFSLQVNGKTDASSGDTNTQVAISVIPLLMHPGEPKDVAMIGLGCGMSAGAALQFPSVRRLDVAEIEPGVIEASRFFDHLNFGVRSDKRAHIRVEDGRNFLLTSGRKYDAIISEPSNPWIAGVAGLYTQDFFRMAAGRLNPGGVFGQWIQAYQLSPESMRMFLATFSSVFPHTHIFMVNTDVVVVGSREPLGLDGMRIARKFRESGMERKFADLGAELDDYGITLAHYVAGPEEVARLSLFSHIHTDNRPEMEFATPFGYFEKAEVLLTMLEKIYPVDAGERSGLAGAALAADDYYGIAADMFAFQIEKPGFDAYIGKALELDPRHAKSLALMGEMQELRGRFYEAASYYRRAVEAGAGNEALVRLAFLLINRGAPEEAETLLKPLLDSGAERADLFNCMALIRKDQGRFYEAADYNLRASGLIGDNPVKARALYSAYMMLKQSGKGEPEFMLEVLAGAHRLLPADLDIALEYAKLLLESGDIAGAGNAIAPAVGANPGDVRLMFFMIELQSILEPARARPR